MKKVFALLLVLVLMASAVPFAMAEGDLEPITITVAGVLPITWNDYPDNSQAKYIKDNLGITIQVIDISERKEALMASGDLPDIFIIESNEVQPLIESGFVLPLDDLVAEYAPGIFPSDDVLNYQREAMGDGEHIYGLTNYYVEGTAGSLWTQSWGMNVDWERYAAIGYPEMTADVDSLYQVMVDMVAVKPETDDGLPVYAIAYPTIEMRGQSLYGSSPLGYFSSNNFTGINCWTGELEMLYTNPDSFIWKFNHMYWKLNQDGLLDPDSFLQDFDTDSLKAVNGQYVATLYHDITGNATRLKAAEGAAGGFQFIPISGSCAWTGADFTYGNRNLRCIASSCKYPDRVMQLLNWVYTPEGTRLITSGIEGETWNYEDGVPMLTADAIEAYQQMDDRYYNYGLAFRWNAGYTGNAADGYNVDLFKEVAYLAQNATALEKSVAEHYGMYMVEKVEKMIEAGEMCTQGTANMRVVNALATLPDDMQRILNEVDQVMNEGMVQCVLAPDEDTYFAMKDALIQQIKDMGMEQVEAWFITNYDELMEKYK
jgi:ABC-type glycerol-3-phosphate transport system substrate-binding protein